MEERQSFGKVFLYQLHIIIQQYLRICTRVRISKINVGILYVSDIISHIETSTWKANTPPWLRDLIKSSNDKKENYSGGNVNIQEMTHLVNSPHQQPANYH